MKNDRRANAVIFGFDFQVNASIVLMIENIKEMKTLRLEGNYEDIDIELDNGKHILAQAKSVVKSSSDFKNVRKNLNNALRTLSEASKKVKIEKAIFITNSPNPFNEDASRSLFWGPSIRSYQSLPVSTQNIIKNYLSQIEQPLNINQFTIQTIPFETDNEAERYKAVMQVINDFIGELNLGVPGLGKKLHQLWCGEVFKNSTKSNADIILTKNSIIWPIIVIATNIDQTDSDFVDRFDSVQYDEIVRLYRDLIDSCCERIEFFTKVLFDFNAYNNGGTAKEKTLNFVDDYWQKYVTEFDIESIDSDIVESLTKVVIYNVIRRRYDINRIKNGVSL